MKDTLFSCMWGRYEICRFILHTHIGCNNVIYDQISEQIKIVHFTCKNEYKGSELNKDMWSK